MPVQRNIFSNQLKLFTFLVLPLVVLLYKETSWAQVGSATPRQEIILSQDIKAARKWRIAFFPKDIKFAFNLESEELTTWEIAWNSMQQAAQDFGVEVRAVYSETRCKSFSKCVEQQIRQIADIIEKKSADGMIVVPFNSNRLAPITEKAISAGIPVMGFDTPMNSDQVTFVSFDNFRAAREMGEWAVKALAGRGKVVILEGDPDNQHAIDRRNGFLAGLAKGDITVLDTETAKWQETVAQRIVAGWLKKFDKIDLIMAASDGMALGAAEALVNEGRSDVMITGFDGWPITLEAIRAGRIAATINQGVELQARFALELLVRQLDRGERFPATVYMPKVELISKDNVGDYLDQ